MVIKHGISGDEVDHEILSIMQRNLCITVGELVNLLSRKYELRDYVIAYRVWSLWKRGGLIDLSGFDKQSTVVNYVFSLEALWFWVALVITIMAYVFIYINNPPVIAYARYFIGSVFITFILGYSAIELAYPRGGDEVSPLERFVLSLGLSLVIIPIVGTVLAYMPFRFTVVSVPTTLTILTVVMLSLAVIRKGRYTLRISEVCR